MILPIKQFIRNATTAANIILGVARQIDYKALNRYILAINESSTLDHILLEASRCLKDILNYHLFAFAVQDAEKLNVWIDPRIYQAPLKQVLKRDFGSIDHLQVHTINEETDNGRGVLSFDSEELLSYSLIDNGCMARMYVLPERKMLPYHVEILDIVVKTLGLALKNYISIKRLEDDAALDALTGCYNRREFDRLVGHHIAGAQRNGRALSIIMLDVDHFKQVNDTHGHLAGDAVLKAISRTVSGAIRKGDYLARYGGEEFVVVLPDTEIRRATELAERLRALIENLEIPLPNGETIQKTASFGVAALRESKDLESLVQAADERLYAAKKAGRNRVMPV